MTSFAAASDQHVQDGFLAVEIAITQPSALTLYLSDRGFIGSGYQAVILDASPLRSKNTGGVGAISHFSFTLANTRIYNQSSGGTTQNDVAADLLASYRLLGATVAVKQFYRHSNGTLYSDTIFTGVVTEVHDITKESITIEVDEDRLLSVDVPRYSISKQTHAAAPEDSIGLKIPISMGQFEADSTITITDNVLYDYIAMLGHPAPLAPCFCYNERPGTAPYTTKRYYITEASGDAAHTLKLAETNFVLVYLQEANCFCSIPLTYTTVGYGAGTLSEANGWYFSIARQYMLYLCYPLSDMAGTGSVATSASITNIDYLLDDEIDNYCTLDSSKAIYLKMPGISPLGQIFQGNAGIRPCVWLSPGGSGNLSVGLVDSAGSALYGAASSFSCNPASEEAGVYQHELTWAGGWDGTDFENWQFGDSYVKLSVGVGDSARIRAVWLAIVFNPNDESVQGLSRESKIIWHERMRNKLRDKFRIDIGPYRESGGSHSWRRGTGRVGRGASVAPLPASNIYFVGQTYDDDASGTYTGTNDALITNPADQIRYLWQKVAGLDSAKINTTASTVGSFPDARADLNLLTNAVSASKTWKAAVVCNEATTASDLTDAILSECPAKSYRDRDGVLKIVVWNSDPATNQTERIYRTVFTWKDHIVDGSFKCGLTEIDDIINKVYIHYGYSIPKGSYERLAFVDQADSDDGRGTVDTTRETACSDSQTAHNVKNEHRQSCSYIHDRYTAAAFRNYWLDRFKNPKTLVECELVGTAADLELGHIIEFSTDLNAHIPCPKFGASGSWSDVFFEVLSIDRKTEDRGDVYRITAMEI